MEGFRSVVATGLGADEAVRLTIATLDGRPGLSTVPVAPGRLSVTRTRRPRWAIVLCVLTIWVFGLGLLFLLVTRTEGGDLFVVEGPRGAVVTVPPLLAGAEGRALVDALTGRSAPVDDEPWAGPGADDPAAATADPAPAPEPERAAPTSQPGDLDAPTVVRPDLAAKAPRRPEGSRPAE